MLRHPWLQGAFLGALALAWMVWHGRSAVKEGARTAAAESARCANSKDLS